MFSGERKLSGCPGALTLVLAGFNIWNSTRVHVLLSDNSNCNYMDTNWSPSCVKQSGVSLLGGKSLKYLGLTD